MLPSLILGNLCVPNPKVDTEETRDAHPFFCFLTGERESAARADIMWPP